MRVRLLVIVVLPYFRFNLPRQGTETRAIIALGFVPGILDLTYPDRGRKLEKGPRDRVVHADFRFNLPRQGTETEITYI